MGSTASQHDAVRSSFERQTLLFTGSTAVFAGAAGAVPEAWGPLDPAATALEVACGAGHVSEQLAPYVRQVVGIDLTPTTRDRYDTVHRLLDPSHMHALTDEELTELITDAVGPIDHRSTSESPPCGLEPSRADDAVQIVFRRDPQGIRCCQPPRADQRAHADLGWPTPTPRVNPGGRVGT